MGPSASWFVKVHSQTFSKHPKLLNPTNTLEVTAHQSLDSVTKVTRSVFWCAATNAKLCFRKRPKFYNKRIRAVHGELLIPSSRVRRRWEGSKSLGNWYKVRTTQPKQETTFVIVTNVHFRYFLRETRALWQFSEQHPEARLF